MKLSQIPIDLQSEPEALKLKEVIDFFSGVLKVINKADIALKTLGL